MFENIGWIQFTSGKPDPALEDGGYGILPDHWTVSPIDLNMTPVLAVARDVEIADMELRLLKEEIEDQAPQEPGQDYHPFDAKISYQKLYLVDLVPKDNRRTFLGGITANALIRCGFSNCPTQSYLNEQYDKADQVALWFPIPSEIASGKADLSSL